MSFAMNDQDLDNCLVVATKIAEEVGEIIVNAGKEDKKIDIKANFADLVTETDQLVEQIIRTSLLKHFPSHKFIGEESVAGGEHAELTDDPTWCVDPIDGTTNFIHTFPYVAVSIGLLVNKKSVVGVIYNPFRKEMFSARIGCGAFLNGKRLKTSSITDLGQSLVCYEFGSSRDEHIMNTKIANARRVLERVHGLRCMGSAACNLAAVAAGQVQAYFEMGIHCWDMAAGVLIVTEAGGVVNDVNGGPLDIMSRKVVAASNDELVQQLIPLFDDITLERD